MRTAVTKRRIGIVSTVVLALVASLLVWIATRSEGEVVRKADLNDGGVWVTNAEQARFGRINKAAGQLDSGVLSDGASGSGLDVWQDGAAIVGFSKASSQVVPINPAEGTLATDQSVVVPPSRPATGNRVFPGDVVDLRGGTIAAVDPAKGALRAQRVDNRSGIETLDALQPSTKPVATVGGTAVVAVGVDGSVYALSAEKGKLVVVRPEGERLGKPTTIDLKFSSKSAQVTAVGTHWVVWDSGTNTLYSDALDAPEKLSVGGGEAGTAAYAALQQPGPDAPTVLVQDESGLTQVQLGDDAPTGASVRLSQAAPGQQLMLSAPVRLGACVHAAWAGPSNVYYGRNCGSPTDTQTVDLGAMRKGVRADGVKLRVNRGLIVLNDLDSGDVWDVDRDKVKIDNWNSVIPPPQTDDKNKKKDQNLIDDEVVKTPPKAMPDSFQVRPGRTSTLYPLDNDSDSQGSILAISPGDVGKVSMPGVTASPSADGQTVQVTVPEEPAGESFTFDYVVNNGTTAKNGRATGKVTVRIVGPDLNTPPRLRAGQARLAQSSYPAVPGGLVKVGVIADWRDSESDPIQVVPGDPDTTGVDGAGALSIRAKAEPGDQTVDYQVDDGRGGVAKASVALKVLGDDDRVVAPRTQPDVLRGVVGKPVQLQPLGNDVPGADPTDPEARLRLAQDVKGPGQLTVDTNLDTNVLTVTGQTPGTSTITYAAQTGAGVSVGRVRVDILPNPSADLPPVAAPDAAVVRGQSPVVADVLSNDYSPRSDVLVVQRVTTGSSWVRASIVQGRWVRVEATSPPPGGPERRAVISYTISDGTKSATGQLAVAQKPVSGDRVLPTVVDDVATVRAGDAVTIPVLDNDSMSEGIPLKLDPNAVKVLSGGGQAFASGTVLRYVPETGAVAGPRTAVLEYAAYPEGLRARSVTGRVTVTVKPLPDATKNPNQPPVARSFSASVTAGDTLSITVPTSGVDPDGDLAFVGGIVGEGGNAVNLKLGRVVGFGAATIRYEAYPRSAGTEVIRYELRDRFGGRSEGFVRVGVVQPGDPQPPVAVEDDVVAAPGRTVRADVLANDLIASGDSVDFEDFTRLNDADSLGQFTRQKDDTFKVVAPEEGPAKVLAYGITDGLFDPSRSTLTVRGQKGFNNPPIAVDDTATPKQGDTSALVDVLANDRDIDGEQASLKIVQVVGEGAAVEGRKVRIQLRPTSRVVPYVIEDADGARAMALVYVPAGNNGQPYVVNGKVLKMGADSTVKMRLGDYVVDPRGGSVAVSSPDTVSTSPSDHLQQSVDSRTELTLTSTNGYVGPAALMLQVTNAKAPGDKTAQTAYVTIPVQIGPDVPVLRCPDHEIRLQADGPSRTADITKLCHVWWPTGMDQNAAQFEAQWDPAVDQVELDQQGAGGRALVLRALPGAKAGSTGAITVNAKGGAEKFRIRVRVTSAPPAATIRPVRVEGLIAGTSRTVNVGQYLDSPLTSPQCAIQGSEVVAGKGVAFSQSGCALTVTASADARGDTRGRVRVTDAAGRPVATGEVLVSVRSKPDPTAAPVAVADRILGGTARVDWRPPAYDGGLPILEYEVSATNGPTQKCASSPCTVKGLTNGQEYTFTVRSRNAVDWSEKSPPSNAVIPDTKPEATSITSIVPGDQRLTVSWAAPPNKGSEIDQYQVQWVNIGGNAGQSGTAKVAAPSLSKTITGLVNNDAYQVRVQAHNGAGWGPYGPEVKAQSFGKPANVPAPTLAPRSPSPGDDNAQVTITWPDTDPNGPPITQYDVFRRSSGGPWVNIATVSGGSQNVATDTIPYQGQNVDYTVTATNGGPATSDKANFSSYTANGYPDTPTLLTATTPREDKTIDVTFRIGNPHAAGYDRIHWTTDGVTGSFPCSGTTCPSAGTTRPLEPTSRTIAIRACNSAGYCSPLSNAIRVHPYGPTQPITNPRESHDNTSITFAWDAPNNNGRPINQYQIRENWSGNTNTQAAGDRTYRVGGLGYDTTRTIQVRANATDSGWGPWTTISGTTNRKVPKVNWLRPTGSTGPVAGCDSGDCQYLQYDLQDFDGDISCTFASSNGPWPYNYDDGTRGSIQPRNTTNTSGKYFGYPTGWVRITCTGTNGSDSFTRDPWGR